MGLCGVHGCMVLRYWLVGGVEYTARLGGLGFKDFVVANNAINAFFAVAVPTVLSTALFSELPPPPPPAQILR